MQDLGIYVVTRHQYGLSGACSSDVINREASGCVAKYRMFSQDNVEQKFSEWQSQYTCSLWASPPASQEKQAFFL